jgi:two-component system sensor histidine kinase PilS (NtrC family)
MSRPRAAGSWFGDLGDESLLPPTGFGPTQAHSRFEDGADGGPPHGAAAPRSVPRPAAAPRVRPEEPPASLPTAARLLSAFVAARAVLGLLLVATQVALTFFATVRPGDGAMALSVGYAIVAALTWWFTVPRLASLAGRTGRSRWLLTIGVDLIAFTGLHLLSAGANNYAALFVLPVLMAGVLTPRMVALAVAALVALLLLGVAWWRPGDGADLGAQLTQAGLAGAGVFVVALLASELAGRLAREQSTARRGMSMARQQAQLNQLVIEEMQEGVMVVDRGGRVRAANPAARRLLVREGAAPEAPFQLRGVPAWATLVQAVERAFGEAAWPTAGRDVVLAFDDGAGGLTRSLRLRVRFTRRRGEGAIEELCVLFLEDLRTVQARARQEKLAAMGRVSAGIAHEIRNPLAAISQANALLAEDVDSPALRQLTAMVSDNVERLKRIVDDVLEVAPGVVSSAPLIELNDQVGTICAEWALAQRLPMGDGSPLRVDLGREPLGVRFEPEHLRRVLVNLLDNALRHGSREPRAVWVQLLPQGAGGVCLSVASDGAPIAADVEPYLFEPFFSTRSRGTGLGLYICRELCERYGASIDYRQLDPGQRHRNVFLMQLPREALVAGAAGLPLAS